MIDSDIEPVFPKYGLKSDPYFREALKIEGGAVPIDTLFGREKEKGEIIGIFQKGGGQCCIVIGDSGVGKTSLVNYARSEAKKASYFSPNMEIGIEEGWKVNDVIINTLQAIYQEIKIKAISLKDKKILDTLEDLFELSRIIRDEDVDLDSVMTINTYSLIDLFRKTTKELVECGYRAVIIQYNNLDNISDFDYLVKLLNNLRDFFQDSHTIFILVGDEILPHVINEKSRLRQIFTFPEIEISPLGYSEILKIISSRLENLRINRNIEVIPPHTEDAIKTLYDLHKGNIRDILNSLSSSVDQQSIKTMSSVRTKQILHEKAKAIFLEKVSPTEEIVLLEIIKSGLILNSELASKLKKKRQHISAYLSKFRSLKAIKIDRIEGTKIYYKPTSEALWLKLEVTQDEILNERMRIEKRRELIQSKLKDFQSI